GRVLAQVRAGAPTPARADRDRRARTDLLRRKLSVGRRAARARVSSPQRRDLHRHGRARVRPDAMARPAGVRGDHVGGGRGGRGGGRASRARVTAGAVGIGIVGYGLMGKAHAFGYTAAPVMRRLRHRPSLRIISGRDRERVAAAAESYGVAGWTEDWRELVNRDDVDIVDICTPPGTHAEIAAAAAAAGKAVICEKPLAVSYSQAASAVEAVTRAKVLNAVGFNYRRLPAVSLMKRMVDEGAVGQVRLVRATWLSDEFVDPAIPFDWRFDRSMGGTTIADLGSHLIDMATWMAGPIAEVSGQSETFAREPAAPPVTVDDASAALARFESGASGVFEMARTAVRRPCD